MKHVYAGYVYDPSVDYEEDCSKIWHDVYRQADGTPIGSVDFTPYAYMSIEDFKIWVDLGMPGRVGFGPLNSESLTKLRETAVFTEGHAFT